MSIAASIRGGIRGAVNSTGARRGLLLDTLAVAPVAAYSVARKLRSAYAGSAIRVRRSSDNAEQDIGYVANLLNTTALTSFCGAGDGFVVTAYDNMPGANHASRAVAAQQPKIVNAGALVTLGGQPAMEFDGADDYLFTAAIASLANAPMSVNGVARVVSFTPGIYRFWWGIGGPSGTTGTQMDIGNGNPTTNLYVGTPLYDPGAGAQIAAGSNYVLTVNHNGTTAPNYLNGTLNSTGSTFAMAGSTGAIALGQTGGSGGGSPANVRISEHMAFAGAVLSTTDRQAIERNQGTNYGITVA